MLSKIASDIFQHGWFCGRERGRKGTDEQERADWLVHAERHTASLAALQPPAPVGDWVERLRAAIKALQSELSALKAAGRALVASAQSRRSSIGAAVVGLPELSALAGLVGEE